MTPEEMKEADVSMVESMRLLHQSRVRDHSMAVSRSASTVTVTVLWSIGRA